MMIGHDDVDAELGGVADYVVGSDSGVDADDELDAGGGRGIDHFALHSIAVEQAMRDVEGRDCAEQVETFFQDDDGGGAVDVVIAV